MNKVISLDFTPTIPVKTSDLLLDLATFKVEKESDTPHLVFRSTQLGIHFIALEDMVRFIEISMTPEQKKLKCSIHRH